MPTYSALAVVGAQSTHPALTFPFGLPRCPLSVPSTCANNLSMLLKIY